MRGAFGQADRLKGLFSATSPVSEQSQDAGLRSLTVARDALLASLSVYEPRVLGTYPGPHGMNSEPLEFLSYLYNQDGSPLRLPQQDLAAFIPRRRLSFGLGTVELGESGHLPRTFAAMMSIKDYPGQTTSGMFDELYRLPLDLTATHSFAFVERQAALGRMELALRRMRSTDDQALSLRAELAVAKDDVAAGRTLFGETHTTFTVKGDSQQELAANVAEVTALLADQGIVAVREDVGVEPAFWAQFPGNFKYVTRRSLISGANFAGLASLHNFAIGQPKGNHWGSAVALLETTAAGPYYFNFHRGDLGNFTVIGPSGSGKTVVLNFLLAQARRFAPRIVFFDKDRGAELFIRAIGGRYDRLRPDAASRLNPLQLDDSPVNRQFLMEWIELLVGRPTSAEEQGQIKDAIDAQFEQPASTRRLRHLVELFRGYARATPDDLSSRLRPWWGNGELAWLFDNEDDEIDISVDTVGFDMTAILDNPIARTPTMLYLFHRIEERLSGDPTIIVVDEGWKALDDDVFVRKIKDWQKTIRKRNGIVGFATQSARDALDSKIASAIIEQAATQIFMVNPKAAPEDYMGGFGLTSHEFELVRSLSDSSHSFLIKSGGESVVARLDLSSEPDLLKLLSGREKTVRQFDRIVAEFGDEPGEWIDALLRDVA